MENYYYKCPKCGFIYQMPEYWASYSPEDTTEYPHIDMKTGEMCENMELVRVENPEG